jgi:hypothetical protein
MDNPNLYEETVRIATELYEKSGRVEGRDLENWMEAEKIVLAATSMSADDDSNNDGHGNGKGNGDFYEETVRTASELYEKSGRVEGRDLENWMEAEKIVLAATSMGADDDSNGDGNGNSYEEIERVATELYEKSGQAEGCDLENWLKAERIVKEGEQFCKMFMQLLVQSPLSACKLMEAIKLLLDLEQKQELERLIGSA